MSNGRCRMHGGTAGAPSGKRNGNYKYGCHTKTRLAEMAYLRALLRASRDMVGEID